MVDQSAIANLVGRSISLRNNICECCRLRCVRSFCRFAGKALRGKITHFEWFHGCLYYVFDLQLRDCSPDASWCLAYSVIEYLPKFICKLELVWFGYLGNPNASLLKLSNHRRIICAS